jgi:hypothetical protein
MMLFYFVGQYFCRSGINSLPKLLSKKALLSCGAPACEQKLLFKMIALMTGGGTVCVFDFSNSKA